MLQMLQDNSIFADFHNADLLKEKRIDLEKSFREKDGVRVLVATSTLAAGVNTPARRVLILGTTRNGHIIPSYEIPKNVVEQEDQHSIKMEMLMFLLEKVILNKKKKDLRKKN